MTTFLSWVFITFLAPMPLIGGVVLGTLARSERYILVGSAVLAFLLVWFQIDGYYWNEVGWLTWIVGWFLVPITWPLRLVTTFMAVALWAVAAREVVRYRQRKSVSG